MTNLIISFIYLILSFIATLAIFKKSGKVGLYVWMSVLVIICNIQTIKMSELFGLTISLGNISYGALFLTTDILSERFGKKAANKSTNLSFIMMILFAIFMTLFLQYKPSSADFSQESLKNIFGYIPRITISSLTAYMLSQKCDAYVYSIIKEKYNKVWLSNNISTFISQALDTIVFVTLSFAFVMSVKDIVSLASTMILFKYIIALIDTPFMIISTKIKNEEIE